MYLRFLLLVVLLTSWSNSPAQGNHLSRKYRLALPDDWQKKHPLLEHLTAIAPLVFTQVKDKQVCLDCRAPYTLMFVYDSLVVEKQETTLLTDQSDNSKIRKPEFKFLCETVYRFRGTWVLMNRDSMAIAEIVLVPLSEKHVYRFWFTLPAPFGTARPDPDAYIRQREKEYSPTVMDIMQIMEKKVMAIQ